MSATAFHESIGEHALNRRAGTRRGSVAQTLEAVGRHAIRYGLVVVVVWIGGMKFTAYEAEGISGFVSHSPLMSWAYSVFSVQSFSALLGVTEIATALLIAARPLSARAALVGSAMAVGMFLTTLSFLLTTPGVWEASAGGFPALSVVPGQFLVKDFVLFGASLWLFGDDWRVQQSFPVSTGGLQVKSFVDTYRKFLALAAVAAIGVGGMAFAHHSGKGEVKVTELSRRDIVEKLDGKSAGATVVEVTFEPGQKDTPHRHAGPVFGYVLEGEYEHAIDDQPVRTYKAGETFYEPSGCVHRVARNPSGKTRTRLLAVILHARDARDVTVPEKDNE